MPLKEGDVCKSGGSETGPGVRRELECPAGMRCLARHGGVAVGGEVTKYCRQMRREPRHPIAVDPMPLKNCKTSCGRIVKHGWSGLGDGVDHCNTCKCGNGMLACTKMMCPKKENLCLAEGDVCKSGGVESGLGVQRELECPAGTRCLARDVIAIGGEVTKYCTAVETEPVDACAAVLCMMGSCKVNKDGKAVCEDLPHPVDPVITVGGRPLEEGDVCKSGGIESGHGVQRENECPEGMRCLARIGDVAIGGEVTKYCTRMLKMPVDIMPIDLIPLKEGDVCKSGGIETGPGVDRERECPLNTRCLARSGDVALGGEVTKYCTPMMRQTHPDMVPLKSCETSCGRVVKHGWSGLGDGMDHCNTCRCNNGMLACTKMMCPKTEKACLVEGDVCSRGGIETGAAVDRWLDCPKGTECRTKD
eukprot:gene706-1078_t